MTEQHIADASTGYPAAPRALAEHWRLLSFVIKAPVKDDAWCMVPKSWLDEARTVLGEEAKDAG